MGFLIYNLLRKMGLEQRTDTANTHRKEIPGVLAWGV